VSPDDRPDDRAEDRLDGPAFDDPAFDELRGLLADARASEPVPDEVVARLDATLTALQEERRSAKVVVPFRRRAGRLLVAAAAVVAIGSAGIAVAQLGGNGGAADNAASGGAADKAESLATTSPRAASPERSGDSLVEGEAPAQAGAGKVPAFTTARFGQEVAGFDVATRGFKAAEGTTSGTSPSPTPSPTPGSTSSDAPSGTLDDLDSAGMKTCAGPAIPDTESFPILLDGEPAVLVVHPPRDGTQLFEGWSCDGTTELAAATVTR
jgi:hypothetical protein